jgi:hypothetical protein
MPFQESKIGVCLNSQEVGALWRFNGRSNSNLDVVVLQHHQSEGGMNNFVTEAALLSREEGLHRKTKC